jgi:hypothetical protein
VPATRSLVIHGEQHQYSRKHRGGEHVTPLEHRVEPRLEEGIFANHFDEAGGWCGPGGSGKDHQYTVNAGEGTGYTPRPWSPRPARVREVSMGPRTALVCALLLAGASSSREYVQPPAQTSGTIVVRLAPSTARQALDGRLLLLVAKDDSRQPPRR